MKVSIIVPIYNVEKYLRKCLDSLVNQTFDDYEIICVNDGSPDNSQAIVDEYKGRYSNIVSIIQKNKGLGGARNTGIENAKGDYIMFVDSDDELVNNALEKLYDTAIKGNHDLVCFGYLKLGKKIFFNKNKKYMNHSACTKFYKKELIKDQKFLEHTLCEDIGYSYRIFSTASNVGYLDEALYLYTVRNDSIIHSPNLNKYLDALKCIDDGKEWLKKNNQFNENDYHELVFHNVLLFYIQEVVKDNVLNKKEVLKQLHQYCENNISNYKKYPFYKNVSLKLKIIGFMYYHHLENIFLFYRKLRYKKEDL